LFLELSEPVVWIPDLSPLVRGAGEREVEWYVLKYVAGKERVLQRIMDFIGVDYKIFSYKFKLPRTRKRSGRWVRRYWIPGYMFVEFDIRRDVWQELLRAPYVLEILGNPSPVPKLGDGSMVDLAARLCEHPEDPASETCIKPGTIVRVNKGSFVGFEAPVIQSTRSKVVLMPMLFGHLCEATVSVRDVTVIG
jgi:transcription antitermination factor NusG